MRNLLRRFVLWLLSEEIVKQERTLWCVMRIEEMVRDIEDHLLAKDITPEVVAKVEEALRPPCGCVVCRAERLLAE